MTVPPLMAARSAGIASSEVKKALTGDVYVRKWTSSTGRGKKKQLVDHEVHFNPLVIAGTVVAAGAAATLGMMALWFSQRKLTTTAGKTIIRRVRIYEPIYKMVTIIDTPAKDVSTTNYRTVRPPVVHGVVIGHRCTRDGAVYMVTDPIDEQEYFRWLALHEPHGVVDITGDYQPPSYEEPYIVIVHYDAVTHEERVLDRAGYGVVYTERGIPLRRFAMTGETSLYHQVTTPQERQRGWTNDLTITNIVTVGKDQLGAYEQTTFALKTDKMMLGTVEREGFLGD